MISRVILVLRVEKDYTGHGYRSIVDVALLLLARRRNEAFVVLAYFPGKGRAAIVNAPEGKPTLQDIRAQQYFDLSAIAEKAGVTVAAIHAMLNGQPVRRLQAELVLDALSEFTGEEYTFDTVSVTLAPEEGEKEP